LGRHRSLAGVFPLTAESVTSVKTNDEREFRQLVVEHAPYVWRVLRSLGVTDADLPDVCQETFIVVHRQLAGFEGRSTLRTWIYGVAVRVASDYRSKAYRRRERASDTLPERSAAPGQQNEMERKQAWQLVDALLLEIDEEPRRVFVLYEIEQLPMREIAAILGCPLSTAYSRLEAARSSVQKSLAARRSEEEAT
jgi:RNA polymerase sigma-70 factor (ECF subfamily)